MSLYKISIKPISSFCSPLQSDTFFGAFCWSYLYRYGERKLLELLGHARKGEPDIIFSNAFLHSMLPQPIGISALCEKQVRLPAKLERYRQYIENKKKERISSISLDEFNKVINGAAELLADGSGSELKKMSWRNMVNRQSGTVENIDGQSSLFEAEETFSSGEYDIYIYSTLDMQELEPVLKEMFQAGIGARRSVGKGAFTVVGKPEIFDGFQSPDKPNAFVALSNFIPGKEDPTEGCYETFVKYPKVSYVSGEEDSPFKKPLIFLKAGSVFFDQPVRAFYGSCIEKVALKGGGVSDEIVTGAYTIAVPCYVDTDSVIGQ